MKKLGIIDSLKVPKTLRRVLLVFLRTFCRGGFNESITWYLGYYFDWRVESHHFLSIKHTIPAHVINTGKMHTWRAAAYHPNEAYSSREDSWYVAGYHFFGTPVIQKKNV